MLHAARPGGAVRRRRLDRRPAAVAAGPQPGRPGRRRRRHRRHARDAPRSPTWPATILGRARAPTSTSPTGPEQRAGLGRDGRSASCCAEQPAQRRRARRRSASACPGRWSTPPAVRSTRRSCPAGTGTTCPAHVQRAFDVPVLIDNDVNIMALGERHAHLPDVDDLVLHQGRAPASAPASSPAASCSAARRAPPATSATCGSPRADDVACRCGNEGCLEAIAAGPPWPPRCARAGRRRPSSGQDVVDLVRGGDRRRRRRSCAQAGRDLGEVVATLVNLINPSVVVIGGALADGRREPARRHPRGRLPAVAAAGDRAPADRHRRRPASGPACSVPPRWPSGTCCPPTPSRPPSKRPRSDAPRPDPTPPVDSRLVPC